MNTREPDTDNTGVGMHRLDIIAAIRLFEYWSMFSITGDPIMAARLIKYLNKCS